jgi:hypothetical protein
MDRKSTIAAALARHNPAAAARYEALAGRRELINQGAAVTSRRPSAGSAGSGGVGAGAGQDAD